MSIALAKQSLPEGFYQLPEDEQRVVIWCLTGAPLEKTSGNGIRLQDIIHAMFSHGRTGTRRQNALFQLDWDVLLNGRPHLVDLRKALWPGTEAAFRTKVYREAVARHLDVKTRIQDIGQLVIQALELPSLPEDVSGQQINPPWYRSQATVEELQIALVAPVPDPVLAPVAAPAPFPLSEDQDWPLEAEDLGPCSCGADSEPGAPHAPSCSIW